MIKDFPFHSIKKCHFLPVLFFLIFSGCENKEEKTTVDQSDFKGAVWIQNSERSPSVDSLLFEDQPSPIFRKEFFGKKNIRKATLYITAAGYYNATLNGERIGKNYLDPAWTDFKKRIYYSEYDLTADIKNGDNCIGVTLGNGFYNPLPMTMWGHLNLKEHLPNGNPEFIASLKMEYADGKSETIATDNSWKYSFGPIRKNNVYLGEIYDARSEINDWNKIKFDDSEWNNIIKSKGPGGRLQKTFFPPIQITDIQTPLSIKSLADGKFIVDMGVNFAGIYKVLLKGKRGDTITIRFGERIYENGELNIMTTVAGQIKSAGKGGPGAPEIAWQADSYIFGDKTDVWFSPEFTFHTYRYMEISGLTEKPGINDIKGILLNTNVDKNSSFSCSSNLLRG